MKKEVRRLSHGELVQMSVAQQNADAANPTPVTPRLSHGELVQLAVAKQNETAAKLEPVDENSNKYLNKISIHFL